MWVNRTSSRMAIGAIASLLVATTTFGQELEGVEGMQLCAPADCSTFGGPIQPNEGYFFQYDLLYWSTSAPKTQTIGIDPVGTPGRVVYYGPNPLRPGEPGYNPTSTLDDTRTENSTLTTSDLTAHFAVGNRIEFGEIEDQNGWLVSIYQLRNQGELSVFAQADVVFKDPPQANPFATTLLSGPVPLTSSSTSSSGVVVRELPVTLFNILMMDEVTTWGVEANYLHRALTCHGGGTLEFFAGPRYLEFDEWFGVQAGEPPSSGTSSSSSSSTSGSTSTSTSSSTTSNGLIVPSFLQDSSWYTVAQNHVVGPQVGVRWFKKQGRWMLSTEARFMAGLNYQNFHQQVNMGPKLNSAGIQGSQLYTPTAMGPTWATQDAYATVFTPLAELRLEGRYQITRAISFHAGWTGFWMDNVARANSVINYQVPAMGIDLSGDNNKQNVIINGLTIGFDVNR